MARAPRPIQYGAGSSLTTVFSAPPRQDTPIPWSGRVTCLFRSRRGSGFDRRAHRGIVSGALMQTPKRVRAAMNRPTRSEHRSANIAVVTVGFAIALQARSPVNPARSEERPGETLAPNRPQGPPGGRTLVMAGSRPETLPTAGPVANPRGTWAKKRKRRRGLSAAFPENQGAGCFRNRPGNSGGRI